VRELWRELLFGARQWRRSPGLATAVAVTIGLGVGSNLAVFALLRAAFVPPTPYADAAALVVVQNTGAYHYGGSLSQGLPSPRVSSPDLKDLEDQQRSFTGLAGIDDGVAVMTGLDRPRSVCRILMTPRTFEVLRVKPLAGRVLSAADFAADAPGAAVLSSDLWQTRFGSDPGVIGRGVALDGQPFTIVGVVAEDAFGLLRQRTGLFQPGGRDRCVITPLVQQRSGESERILKYLSSQRDAPSVTAIGRLRPGVSIDQARSDLHDLGGRLRTAYPSTNRSRSFYAEPLDRWRTSEVQPLLLMLTAAAVLAFLVALANAAGLIVTETVRRQSELAIRQALGAGPSALLRVVLAHAVVWALPGAVLGFFFGLATLALVRWGSSAGGDRVADISMGPTIAVAGLVLTLLAGLATGGVASWTLHRHDVAQALREGGLTASAGRRRHRLTTGLVAFQLGAATTLAIGAALLVHSMWNIVSADRGFDLARGFFVQVRLPRARYRGPAEQVQYYQKVLRRVRALPGVLSAGVSASPPLSDTAVGLSGDLKIVSPAGSQDVDRLSAQFVTRGYLETLNVRLLRGRFFTEADEQTDAPVVVVDERFARRYVRKADPLASSLRFGRDALQVVGVVGEVNQATTRPTAASTRLDLTGMTYLLFPRFNGSPTWSFVVVRASGNLAAAGDAAVREMLTVDPEACLDEPRTFTRQFAARIADRRRTLSLVAGFAVIVLLLTAVSVSGALGQFVAVHARDIAIRLAVGASRRDILAITSRHLAVALSVGLVLGGAGGVLMARMLESQLYGVEAADPATIASAVAVLALLAVLAAAAPVWRACRVNPVMTLRAL
jgi:predicted permease